MYCSVLTRLHSGFISTNSSLSGRNAQNVRAALAAASRSHSQEGPSEGYSASTASPSEEQLWLISRLMGAVVVVVVAAAAVVVVVVAAAVNAAGNEISHPPHPTALYSSCVCGKHADALRMCGRPARDGADAVGPRG